MKLNLASGAHPLTGFCNLDKQNGWTFESGLPFADESVDAVTESHGLMYVELDQWDFVFSEIARVLVPGGVVRITEDSTDDPRSARYGGFHDAVTLTSALLVIDHLAAAGLKPYTVSDGVTNFPDKSLCQAWHGRAPKVFFVEGVKR